MKSLLIACLILSLQSFNVFAQTVVESSDGVSLTIKSSNRIITIGGAVTETAYALGFGDNVVATDASSTYPRQVFQLPRVPYVRNLTAEGILALAPDLILSSSDANPVSAIQQIRNAGTNMLLIKEQESLEGANNKLAVIGKALNAEES